MHNSIGVNIVSPLVDEKVRMPSIQIAAAEREHYTILYKVEL